MNKFFLVSVLFFALVSCNQEDKDGSSSENGNQTKEDLENPKLFPNLQAKQSYAFGMIQARDLKQMYSNPQIGDKVDRTEILAGLEDILLDNEILYNEDSANAVAKSYLTMKNPTLDQKREASYCIGLVEGWYIKDFFTPKNIGVTLDYSYLFDGLKDALDNKSEPKMEYAMANKIVSPIMSSFVKRENEAFLVDNAKQDSIETTESGLQYKVLKKGTGKQAKNNSKVKVHYTGRLINGKVFDSSIERGDPIAFTLGVGQVIKGWDEGIALMKEGAEYMLYIPSDLAYGPRGNQGIPGNATLIFKVKLIEVN